MYKLIYVISRYHCTESRPYDNMNSYLEVQGYLNKYSTIKKHKQI